MKTKDKIQAATGRVEADTLFTRARILNVFTGEILESDMAVKNGHICGFGPYDAKETIDLDGQLIVPGFLDTHVHIESSMVTPAAFSRALLPLGTTTVVADPHEIANVLGIQGINYMLDAAREQLMNILFALPSCVPATHMETSGANLDAAALAPLIRDDRIPALAEMMNYPGVIFGDPDVIQKIDNTHDAGKPVDGHAPGVKGRDLSAYAAAGIASDHECTTAREALEKMRLGMHIMIREGTCAKNLDDLFPAITHHTWHRMMWCTDDRHPEEILGEGHIDQIIRRAIQKGLDPVRAIQMGTINGADYFGLKNVGALAPGRRADMVVISDLKSLTIERVYARGIQVTGPKGADALPAAPPGTEHPNTMALDPSQVNLKIPARGDKIRVIQVIPDQVVTGHKIMPAVKRDGLAVADPKQDLLKIAVVERYTGNAGTARGFVTGLGLTRGALASSVAHDSHNIITAGCSDHEMHLALQAVVRMGGGLAVVEGKEVMATLPLPVAGLMSDKPLEEVNRLMAGVIQAAKALGSPLKDPFMALGFLALPVIPILKITDKGLVDVERFELTDLFPQADNR